MNTNFKTNFEPLIKRRGQVCSSDMRTYHLQDQSGQIFLTKSVPYIRHQLNFALSFQIHLSTGPEERRRPL